MVKPSCFFLHIIAKHLYTILAPVKFQWGTNLPISELALDAKTRGDMSINLLGVWFTGARAGPMYWPEKN